MKVDVGVCVPKILIKLSREGREWRMFIGAEVKE